jgi:creatinine amidohydrolase
MTVYSTIDSGRLMDLTTDEVNEILRRPPTAVLLPVGSVEPHGPHLPLSTDLKISEHACQLALAPLSEEGITVLIAPSVPYGVTEFATGFKGAVSVPGQVLTPFLSAIAQSLLADGWSHVCIVNNHFEPANDSAVRASVNDLPTGGASVACPLRRRWAHTLSEEFRSGACHAGRYETSLMLAAGVGVRPVYKTLAPLDISLSDGIAAGKTNFVAMGMHNSYTGKPAEATQEEGQNLFEQLKNMIVTEVSEAIKKSF